MKRTKPANTRANRATERATTQAREAISKRLGKAYGKADEATRAIYHRVIAGRIKGSPWRIEATDGHTAPV